MHTPLLKRDAICYGIGIGTAYLSLPGATSTGPGTLYDHPPRAGKADHSGGGCLYSPPLLRTVQRWIKNYREQRLAGLADAVRADKRVVAREEEEGEERGPRATPCRPLRFFLDDVEPEMADPVTRSIFPSSSPGILRGQRTREAPARKRYRAADA